MLPLLLGITFGLIDFGFLMSDRIQLQQGVRDTARSAVVAEFGPAGSCSLTGASANASTKSLICGVRASVGGSADTVRVRTRILDASGAAATYAEDATLVVCVQRRMSSRSGLFAPLFDNRVQLAKVAMRVEVAEETVPLQAVSETALSGSSWTSC